MTYPLVVIQGIDNEYLYYKITQPTDGAMIIALGDATQPRDYAASMYVSKNGGPTRYCYNRSVAQPTNRYVDAKGKAGDVYVIYIYGRYPAVMWLNWCVSTEVVWNPWQNSAYSRIRNQPYQGNGRGSENDVSGPPWVIGFNTTYQQFYDAQPGTSHIRTARSGYTDHRVMPPPGTTIGYYVAKAACDAGVGASINPIQYPGYDSYDRTSAEADIGDGGTTLGYSGGFIANNYGFDSPSTVYLGAFNAAEWNFDPLPTTFTNDAAGKLQRDSIRYMPVWQQYLVNGLGTRLGGPTSYYGGLRQGWIENLDQVAFEWAEDWGPLNYRVNSYISLHYSWTRSVGAPYAGLWSPAGTGSPPRVVDPMILSLRDAGSVPLTEFSRWWTGGELNALPVIDSFTVPDPDPIIYSGLFESGGTASGSGFVHPDGFQIGNSYSYGPWIGWKLVDENIDQSATYTKRLVTTNSIYPTGVSNIETVHNFWSFFFGYYFNDWAETGSLSGKLVIGRVYPNYRWGEPVEHFDTLPLPNLTGAVGPTRVHFAHVNTARTVQG